MTLFQVLAPPDFNPQQADDSLEQGFLQLRLIPSHYSLWAFLFPIPWLLFKRMWLVFLGYSIIMVMLQWSVSWWGTHIAALLSFALALIIGLEAHHLHSWSLRRKGWQVLDLVYGTTKEAAEMRFFEHLNGSHNTTARSAYSEAAKLGTQHSSPERPSWRQQDILGLFPNRKKY